jgi:hypothetical protein
MKPNSKQVGASTFPKVLTITSGGVLLEIEAGEFFLPYSRVPWFKNASVSDVLNVEMSGKHSIRWNKLDVDLEIESLLYPEKYPLVAKYN